MLLEILKQNEDFLQLPLDKQDIFATLAIKFESTPDALYFTTDQLTTELNIANRQLWQEFLNLEPVDNYINQQMSYNTKIAFRQSFQSLQNEATKGDVSASKQINELSGILEKKDSNKIIVLHHISRPTVQVQSND